MVVPSQKKGFELSMTVADCFDDGADFGTDSGAVRDVFDIATSVRNIIIGN